MFLLDTCVISELRPKLKKINPGVLAWAGSINPSQMFISSITIFEIEMGILAKERKDKKQGEALRLWFENQVRPAFKSRILPFGEDAAILCASLHVPDPKAERDGMMAAIAMEHRMPVVTRNERDFAYTGVKIINPWTE
ncbi:MAG: type II toxin-antitoxin system VapC family toxin [Cellvibrionaceae bacterium]